MGQIQFAFPGLQTPRAVNRETHIQTDENGSLFLLLHAGRPGDIVNYCVVVGGNRIEGVVKDPSYGYVNGLDGREMDVNIMTKRPQFSYITKHLPDGITIPKLNINGCPVKITELNCSIDPVYFILKMPATSLPVGDTVVQVSINGHRRDYIVSRAYFGVHACQSRDLSGLYKKQYNSPEGAFELKFYNNKQYSVDVHIINDVKPETRYMVYMFNREVVVDLGFTWTPSGLLKVNFQSGLPAGRYRCVVAYSNDNKHWKRAIAGYVNMMQI